MYLFKMKGDIRKVGGRNEWNDVGRSNSRVVGKGEIWFWCGWWGEGSEKCVIGIKIRGIWKKREF